MKAVWIYVDTSKEVGDADHLKVFANTEAADRWLEEHDPDGVAFEYPVICPVISTLRGELARMGTDVARCV
jgi:hypothetical protein